MRVPDFLNWFWKGCKPNSVCPDCSGERIICLGSRYPESVRFRGTWSGPLRDSLFGLAPDGVFRAASLALRAVVSYTTFSPLPADLAKRRRFDFLWHCPSEGLSTFRPRVSQSNGLELRGIAPFGVRTFLCRPVSTLRSMATGDGPAAILRPSKTRERLHESGKISRWREGFHGAME